MTPGSISIRVIALLGVMTIIAVLGIAVVLTILTSPPPPSTIRDLQITDIVIGTPANATEATKEAPKLKQSSNYTTAEPIALRVTTGSSVTSPVNISARLVDPVGEITALDPTKLTITPGTSTFCCWHIPVPGKFSLQLFRPDGIITTVPLEIRPGSKINQ